MRQTTDGRTDDGPTLAIYAYLALRRARKQEGFDENCATKWTEFYVSGQARR